MRRRRRNSYYSFSPFGQIALPIHTPVTTGLRTTSPTTTSPTAAPAPSVVTALPLTTTMAIAPITTKTVQLAPIQTSLLATAAMKSTGTKPTYPKLPEVMMSPESVAAVGPAKPLSVMDQGGGGSGGGGPTPPSAADFAAYCASEKGSLGANGVCTFPDGAQAAFKDGNAVCVNTVGRCGGAAGATAPAGKGKAALIGAAALAALMFLR